MDGMEIKNLQYIWPILNSADSLVTAVDRMRKASLNAGFEFVAEIAYI